MVGSVCAHVSDLPVPEVPSKREMGEERIFLSEELVTALSAHLLQLFVLSDYLEAEILKIG